MPRERTVEDDNTNEFIPIGLIKNLVVSAPGLIGFMFKNPQMIKDNIPAIKERLKMGRKDRKALEKTLDIPIGLTQRDIDSVTEEDIKRATYEEKYLRPVRFSPVNHPEIVALAKKLGAFDESLPKDEYAQNVFEFVKNNIKLGFGPMKDPLEMLKTGSGLCVDQAVLTATLAKAGGVPAKCAILDVSLADEMIDTFAQVEPGIGGAFELIGGAWPHGSAYLYLNERWLSADAVMSDGLQAALGNPLAEMGQDVVESGVSKRQANIYSLSESLPRGMSGGGFLMGLLGKTLGDMNSHIEELEEIGGRILKTAGRDGYVEQIKKMAGPTTPELPSMDEIREFRKNAKG